MTEPLQIRNDEQVALLSSDFQSRYESTFAWRTACSMFQFAPGVRGFWPFSAFGSTGNAFDLSGNIRTLTLNGNPEHTYFQNGLIPTPDLDGTGDYFSAADHASLDITGTEAYVAAAARGLTMGGWFRVDNYNAVVTPFMGKWQVALQLSYILANIAGAHEFRISSDGAAQTIVSSGVTRVADEWFFIVGRFDPSTELAIFVDNIKDTNVAAIPASIFSGTSDFEIGREAADTPDVYLDGYPTLNFLCAEYVPDTVISSWWHQTRALFGK